MNEVEKTILPSARKGSVKALFIITDGNSNIGGKPKKAAEVLKRKKVEIYVVGIGKKVTQESLYDLASEPKKEHVFNIKAYKDLKKVRRKIVVPPGKKKQRKLIAKRDSDIYLQLMWSLVEYC